jgi:hypothetical protein
LALLASALSAAGWYAMRHDFSSAATAATAATYTEPVPSTGTVGAGGVNAPLAKETASFDTPATLPAEAASRTRPETAGPTQTDQHRDNQPRPTDAAQLLAADDGDAAAPQPETGESTVIGPETIINITNIGDKIIISRTAPGVRPPRPQSAGDATDLDNTTVAANAYDDTNQATEERWPTDNCPSELPEGSTAADAAAMSQTYGCLYLQYCQAQDGDPTQIICTWGFSQGPPATS